MDIGQPLALLVTGSIAAIKTIPLVKALRKNNFDVTVLLTRAPEQWKWVDIDEATKASGKGVLTDGDARSNKEKNLVSSKVVLIAPASADFLYQLAHASSELARIVLEAQKRGSKIMIAPAMNYKMWHHPAVQRNCDALSNAGAVFLGPAKGRMACGDDGFGRMIDVDEIASGAQAALAGTAHKALSYCEEAKRDENIPFSPSEATPRIVVAFGGGNILWPDVEMLIEDLKQTKLPADYVIDPTWAGYHSALERAVQQNVATDYFQIPEFKGMEHIRLPERARCVFIPFLDDALAAAMTQGKADTLFLGLYLASKAPVITTNRCLQELSPSLASILKQDGMAVVEDVKGLARYVLSGQSS